MACLGDWLYCLVVGAKGEMGHEVLLRERPACPGGRKGSSDLRGGSMELFDYARASTTNSISPCILPFHITAELVPCNGLLKSLPCRVARR
jgi:hypothetical protein